MALRSRGAAGGPVRPGPAEPGERSRAVLPALRTTQAQIRLAREDEAALQERAALMEVRVRHGLVDHLDLDRQQAELAAVRAQMPALRADEAASINQLGLLLGRRPGALRDLLVADTAPTAPLPDLSLGLPSEVALRRPDIRGAEAQLARTTADIGVARANLYASISLGGWRPPATRTRSRGPATAPAPSTSCPCSMPSGSTGRPGASSCPARAG